LESPIRQKCFMFIVYKMTPGNWYTVNNLVYYKQLCIMAGDFSFIVYEIVYSIQDTTATSPIQYIRPFYEVVYCLWDTAYMRYRLYEIPLIWDTAYTRYHLTKNKNWIYFEIYRWTLFKGWCWDKKLTF
jgi:hypothetical protein